MKTKNFVKSIFGIFLLFFLIGNVSAVTVYSDWETGSTGQETIDFGQEIDFNVDTGSLNPPITLNVKLYDSDYNLVHNFENNKQIGSSSESYTSFYGTYAITQDIYSEPGNYELIVSTEDGAGSAQGATLNLNVNPPENNPPEITSSPVTEVEEESYYEYQVEATDDDNDDLTYSLVEKPSWLSISNSGLISGTVPEVSQDTDYNVKVKVSDGEDYDTQSYTLNVRDVFENTAPLVEIISPTREETFDSKEITVEFSVSDSEDNLDSCEYDINGNTNSLSCSEGTNTFDLSSGELYEGTNRLTITAEDSEGAEDSDSVSFTIDTEEPNNPPTIENIPDQTIVLGKERFDSFDLDNYASDPDGDDLTYSYSGNQKIIVEIDENNVVSLSPPKSWTGKEDIKFTVTDSEGESDSTTASFEVTEKENNPPEITSSPVTEVDENTQYEYQVDATDEDGDSLTYSLVEKPSWLSISNSGLISGTVPEVSQDTDYNVKVKVSDGEDYDTQSYTLTVRDNDTEDTTPPEITVISPEQGEEYSQEIDLKLLVYLNEEGNVNYSLNGNDNKTMNKDGTVFTSDMLDLSEGEHEVTFYAKDEAGNKANKTVEFKIKSSDDGDGNTGVGDSDDNDVCYKVINGNCLTYEDYLYYKQHTPGEHPIYLNQTDDSSEGDESNDSEFNLVKWIFWVLLITVIALFAVIMRYAWKAYYVKNKIK